MKKSFLILLVCYMVILPILTDCSSRENETKTVSAYVCIREYDGNHGLNNEMIDTFMSKYCEENNHTYTPWNNATHNSEDYFIRSCGILSEKQVAGGMGFEYPDEAAAIRAFHSTDFMFSKPSVACVSRLPAFSVRVGKYIFWGLEGDWAALLSQVGIDIQPVTYQVSAKEEIPYLQLEEAFTANELLDLLENKGYSVYHYEEELYTIVSSDGLTTFSIGLGSYLDSINEHKNDLYKEYFYPLYDGICPVLGLTVYRLEDCVVIGRGDTFLSVLGE